jgi:hypothetical protein
MTDKISRRSVLLKSLQIPVAGAALAALSACSKSGEGGSSTASAGGTVCADLNAMSDADQAARKSNNYVEAGPNPEQVCGKCSFFHPGTDGAGGCGTCDIFSGGPVNSHGHCNSWSAKG